MDTKQKLGPLMMLCASVCFAGGGAALKFIPWNALAINGARNFIAMGIFGLYMLITKHKLKVNTTVLAGAACSFGVTTLFVIANKLTTAGNAIILQFTCPVWIIILMFLFFHQKPDKFQIATIFVVFAGILCFFFDSISGGGFLGNVIAILSGAFYAGVFMLNQFERGDAISSLFLGQLISGLLLSPLVLRENDFSQPVILAVLFLGVVQVGLAYLLFSYGTKYTHPVTASLINGVEPILNPIIVAVMFGEVLSKMSLIGAFIVIGTVLIYNIFHKES
ncbi:MAG: DMT family transporter [Lachnospiraceae bacterium]|nr:DMT family transporter [Lachnospiraceae bacterium]